MLFRTLHSPFNGGALSDGSFSSSCTYPDHAVSLNALGGELRIFGFRGSRAEGLSARLMLRNLTLRNHVNIDYNISRKW